MKSFQIYPNITFIENVKQKAVFIVVCFLIFGGISVSGQSIVISEGSYLYIKSSQKIYTDTILHIKSGDLAHFEINDEKTQRRYIAKKHKKKGNPKAPVVKKTAEKKPVIEFSYSFIPVQKHFISGYFTFSFGISVQNYVHKAIKTDSTNILIENKLYVENKKTKVFSDILKYRNQNTPYRQRPPPLYFS